MERNISKIDMETPTGATAMKSNSTVASIKLGYQLFAGNFKKIFKASWLFALLFGLVCAAVGPILCIKMPAILTQVMVNPASSVALARTYTAMLAVCLFLLVIGGVMEILFYSRGFALLKGHAGSGKIERPKTWLSFDKPMAWRTAKGVLASLLVAVVANALIVILYIIGEKASLIKPDAIAGVAAWGIVVLAVALLVYIPVVFIAMKYILDDTTRYWPLFFSAYKTALRHFGYIFVVEFFAGMVFVVATYVLQLPAVILATANYEANLGVVLGDPLGMPSFIVPLTAIVFFISGFMQAYIRMSALFPFYYMYGSIETQEKEKTQFALETKENNDK